MAVPAKKAAGEYDAGATFHRIRITLTTSKSVANLEKVCVRSKKCEIDEIGVCVCVRVCVRGMTSEAGGQDVCRQIILEDVLQLWGNIVMTCTETCKHIYRMLASSIARESAHMAGSNNWLS